MKTLLVVLSEKCNLNCSYCDVDKWSKKTIDPELYLIEFRKMREQYPDETIKIDFFGGEPLLQIPLIKIILDGVRNDGNIKLFMPTNGLLLTDEIADWLVEEKIETSISFDGLWQDRNRLQLNGRGTLERFWEKRELFHRLPKVSCHTMIDKGCYNLLENHLYIRDNFGFNPQLTLVRDIGTWDDNRVEKLKVGIDELFDWYVQNPQEEMPYFIKHFFGHVLNYKVKHYVTDNCGAGSDVWMFSENKVVPCTRFKDEPELIEIIPKYAKMKECETCEVKNVCEKGCLYEQIKNGGPIVELCDLYKHIYGWINTMTARLRHNQYFIKTVQKELENV